MSDGGNKPRPSIPEELRRQILVEAGHRCAIPTCRYTRVQVHHIIPWRTCQEHSYDNLIALCPNCHDLADRGDIDRKSLKLYKHNLRFVHDKFSQFEFDVLISASRQLADQPMDWPPFMNIFINRIVDAGYVRIDHQKGSVFVSGMQINSDHLYITKEGREFIKNIKSKKL